MRWCSIFHEIRKIIPHFASYGFSKHGIEVFKNNVILISENSWELISSSSDVIPVRNSSSLQNLLPSRLNVETRLQKLEFSFNTLKIYDEDCRQRLLCEIAENPSKYAPLSNALLEETRSSIDTNYVSSTGPYLFSMIVIVWVIF